MIGHFMITERTRAQFYLLLSREIVCRLTEFFASAYEGHQAFNKRRIHTKFLREDAEILLSPRAADAGSSSPASVNLGGGYSSHLPEDVFAERALRGVCASRADQ